MADPKDKKDNDLDSELGLDRNKKESKSEHSLDDIDPIFSKKPVEHSEKPIQVDENSYVGEGALGGAGEIGRAHV